MSLDTFCFLQAVFTNRSFFFLSLTSAQYTRTFFQKILLFTQDAKRSDFMIVGLALSFCCLKFRLQTQKAKLKRN